MPGSELDTTEPSIESKSTTRSSSVSYLSDSSLLSSRKKPASGKATPTSTQPPTPDDEMFKSRKYSALPTSQGSPHQKRKGGGSMPKWKKYCILLGVSVTLVMLLAAGRAGQKFFEGSSKGSQDASEYDYEAIPSSDSQEFDYEEFSSPPLLPPSGNHAGSHAATGSDAEIDEDEEEGSFNILPYPDAGDSPVATEDDEDWPEGQLGYPDEDGKGGKKVDFGGSKGGIKGGNTGGNKGGSKVDFEEIGDDEDEAPVKPVKGGKQPIKGDKGKGNAVQDTPSESTGPSSFESDPDPSSTTFCTSKTQKDKSKPLIQYALTIDAGSTGSRIHVYKFHNCLAAPTLEYETFKAVQPGLSSFARDPTAAAESLDSLLMEAMRVVPRELQKCTPVEVKATAGLRLLPGKEGDAILDEVRRRLEVDWPFVLDKADNAVEIMDGKDEGVYAWITANYLLGKIGEGATSTDTIAVMDLGGASTQIVFEPSFSTPDSSLVEGDHKYSLSFGGKDFTLYQHSYLGYGLMRARRSVHNLVAFTWSFMQPGGEDAVEWEGLDEEVEVPNPCLPYGTRRRVELDPPGRSAVNVTMVGTEGGFAGCNRVVELVMAKDAICEVKPCSFNGVYQPSLLDTFPSGQLLALSYFTDRIQPLLASPPPPKSKGGKGGAEPAHSRTLTIGTLQGIAKDVCAGKKAWKKRWGKDKVAMAELEDRPEYCLDLTFMHALLGLGYELGEDRELVVEKKLRGVELGWALGAGIAMLEKATLTCNV